MTEPMRQLIHATPNGQAARCMCCHEIEVVFGNVMIVFTEQGLNEFAQFIQQLDAEQLYANNAMVPHARRVLIQLPSTRVRMAFRLDEIAELRQLLQVVVRYVQSAHITNAVTPQTCLN